MARYVALRRGWVSGRGLVQEGETFDWNGPPGSWMVLESEAPKPVAAPEPEPELDTLHAIGKQEAARDAEVFERLSGRKPRGRASDRRVI